MASQFPPPPPPPPPPPHAHRQDASTVHQHPSQMMMSAPPPPHPAQQAAPVHEPYGSVATSTTTQSSTSFGTAPTRRRTSQEATGQYGYQSSTTTTTRGSPSKYGGLSHPAATVSYSKPSSSYSSSSSKRKTYSYNGQSLVFLLLPLFPILWWHSSPYPLQVFLFVTLGVYALDLSNDRDMTAVGIWIAFAILSATNAWCTIIASSYEEDDDGNNEGFTTQILRIAIETFLFLCLACWSTLQFEWLYKEMPSFATRIECMLHSILPPVSSTILTYLLTSLLTGYRGIDRAATLSPYIFAFFLLCGMLWLGSCPTSFSNPTSSNDNINNGHDDSKRRIHKDSTQKWIIPSSTARIHSTMLLFIPPIMHIVAFRGRIISSYASFDEWNDLILVWSVPYLLHYGLAALHQSDTWKGPYSIPSSSLASLLFPQPHSGKTLRDTFIPMVVSIVASVAFQQRHIIPWCHGISYHFNGHELPSTLTVSIYLSSATLCTLFAIWVWGRTSSTTGQPLFGEYQEDIVQIAIGAGGMLVGKATGMQWSLTPLPILLVLGLTVWLSTRMLRFLSIVLFVGYSAAALLFSYRYTGIDYNIALSIPGISVNLWRLGMIAVTTSLCIIIVLGFAIRPTGGVGAELLKKFDAPGIILIGYILLLTMMECTLLVQPIPFYDLTGVEHDDLGIDSDPMIYNAPTALMTSLVVAAITWFLQRYRVISGKSALIALSVAIGKGTAVFIYMQGLGDDNDLVLTTDTNKDGGGNKSPGFLLLMRSMVASLTLIVMLAPRAFLSPVHVRLSGGGSSSRFKRQLGPSGKPVTEIPQNAGRTIFVYAIILLPLALTLSVPMVLKPLIGIISGRHSGAYYSLAPAASEMVGFASALWGLSCMSMLSHYLPDGGAEIWKKASALTFVMGLGCTLAAPTLPDWIGRASTSVNPFASISSLGSDVVITRSRSSGGWGLIAASLATLLALTGPLELQERRYPSGRKDRFVLLRLMIFSILFGCGVALFITLQSMSEEEFLPVFLTTTACMAMSFFGTVAGVLGYFLELQNFDEAEQVVSLWGGAFPVFLLIAGISGFVKGADHPFGVGGWLSTYLSVCACVTLGFAVVVQSRKTKNASTRGLGNLSCIISWLFTMIVLYGRFGVAGLDAAFDVTTVFGIPISVFGTFLLSPILLALEGETSSERPNKIQSLSAKRKPVKSSWGINLKHLHPSNRFAPLVAGTAAVLLCASMYALFLRGCGLLIIPGLNPVPTTHEDVFKSIYGGRTTSLGIGDDLASMARKNLIHSQAIVTAAKLAGSGFWSADNLLGPLLHLGGLLAVLPSLRLLLTHMLTGEKSSVSMVTLCLPLNVIPLTLCRGIPTLSAAALLGGIGALIQLVSLKNKNWESMMRI